MSACLRDLLPEPANFQAGVSAYRSGDFDMALAQFSALAEDGDPNARYNLGIMYARGHGVDQDVTEATNWFIRTVEEESRDFDGYDLTLIEKTSPTVSDGVTGEVAFFKRLLGRSGPSAEYEAGVKAFRVQDYATARALLEPLAQDGDPGAQGVLAFMYELGLGVTANRETARDFYRQAAANGDPSSQFNLGLQLAAGNGATGDAAEAAGWYRSAASQGLPQAQNNIGVRYATGAGVPRNSREALRWLRRAAEQGIPEAEFNLGVLNVTGSGTSANKVEAARYFRLAAEKGVASAQYDLGMMLLRGDGVPQDAEEAVTWLRRAATLGAQPNGLPLRISSLAGPSVNR